MCDTSFLHKSPTEQRTSRMFYYTAAEQLYCAQRYITTALGGEVHRIFYLCPVILHASRTAIVYGHCLNSVIFLQASPYSSEKILTNKRVMDENSGQAVRSSRQTAFGHPAPWGADWASYSIRMRSHSQAEQGGQSSGPFPQCPVPAAPVLALSPCSQTEGPGKCSVLCIAPHSGRTLACSLKVWLYRSALSGSLWWF